VIESFSRNRQVWLSEWLGYFCCIFFDIFWINFERSAFGCNFFDMGLDFGEIFQDFLRCSFFCLNGVRFLWWECLDCFCEGKYVVVLYSSLDIALLMVLF
jgi:hypothetical protein